MIKCDVVALWTFNHHLQHGEGTMAFNAWDLSLVFDNNLLLKIYFNSL